MKKLFALLLAVVSTATISAQTIYEEFESQKLGERRQIKIQLPRGYDNSDKSYPLVLVLDGDYMFEIVAANVDYYSYWEDMPEALVVGINQVEKRFDDTTYSEQNSLPIDQGANFFEFITMELIPSLISNYRLEDFRVAVGHGTTANFINYFLLKEQPIFQAYISVSPDLAPDVKTYLSERLPSYQGKLFYYLANGTNDRKSIKKGTKDLNTAISSIDNKNILYKYHEFEDATHYNTPARAIPRALESIFLVFQPISKKEYKESILKLEGSPVQYLTEKYETIKELFGIDKPILVNDFKAIAAAIEKKEKYEYYEELGKIARKQYPDTLLGSYYLARFYEETGEPKKAMKTYKSAYILEEIAGITKDLMLEKAEEIKADFGY